MCMHVYIGNIFATYRILEPETKRFPVWFHSYHIVFRNGTSANLDIGQAILENIDRIVGIFHVGLPVYYNTRYNYTSVSAVAVLR